MLKPEEKQRRIQWGRIVKRNVEKRKPKNIDELELFLSEEFKNIDVNTVKNSVMSMKKRCLSLIDSKGERIKY